MTITAVCSAFSFILVSTEKCAVFCKIVNNSLLFYSVNLNPMLLQSSMYQYYFLCTPGFYFLWLFCKKKSITNRNLKQVDSPKCPAHRFLHRGDKAGHGTLFFCLIKNEMPQAAVQSSVLLIYLHPVYFGESEGL